MDFQSVKGFRDFYPEAMAVRNHICDAWRRVSLRNGFVEYDGPILEYLDLYRVKSGDEIVSQLFSLTDRGGRGLAIRPEITPTLARMVNAKINTLPRPIKWFSMPRLCRGEPAEGPAARVLPVERGRCRLGRRPGRRGVHLHPDRPAGRVEPRPPTRWSACPAGRC